MCSYEFLAHSYSCTTFGTDGTGQNCPGVTSQGGGPAGSITLAAEGLAAHQTGPEIVRVQRQEGVGQTYIKIVI